MDKLAEIIAAKRRELEVRTRPVRAVELERAGAQPRPGFAQALRRERGLGLLAEIKRRSPSAGVIRADIAAEEQARAYYNAGVDAISVLTDEAYFGGSIRDLWEVNDLLRGRPDTPPTLRKDFFVDALQVLEAAEAGASAVLLIVRALDDDTLKRLREAADHAGLDSLYEVHAEAEVERALALDAQIIGVNNRDLRRFTTDLGLSERLLPQIPDRCLRLSESGIARIEDAARVRAAGADAVLVGEALMRMDALDPFVSGLHALD